jgi:hypothetical protein
MMGQTVKLVLAGIALLALALLAGQCAYSSGEWLGSR